MEVTEGVKKRNVGAGGCASNAGQCWVPPGFLVCGVPKPCLRSNCAGAAVQRNVVHWQCAFYLRHTSDIQQQRDCRGPGNEKAGFGVAELN